MEKEAVVLPAPLNTETIHESFIIEVETRIPFLDQAKARGLTIDPSVIYIPRHEAEQLPYAVRLYLIQPGHPLMAAGLSPARIMDVLSPELRPATPFEGLAASSVLDSSLFFHALGGDYDAALLLAGASWTHTLIFDSWFGQRRVCQGNRNVYDGLVGFLAAFRSFSP